MGAGGLLGDQALGGVLRPDAGGVDGDERIAPGEQGDMRLVEIVAPGVDEDQLAFMAGALLQPRLALRRRKCGQLGIEPLGGRELGGLRLDRERAGNDQSRRRHKQDPKQLGGHWSAPSSRLGPRCQPA